MTSIFDMESDSAFHEIAKPLCLFAVMQFQAFTRLRTENRRALFPELP